MRFSEFRQYQPKPGQNVFGFVCEDDFLVEESRAIWLRIFGGSWVFEKYSAKEFEEIPPARLMDDALTPSLFTENRAFLVTNAEKLRTYVGDARQIEARDIDVLILRSEQFGPFELDDAVLARDYKKAVQVLGAMLGEGVDPLIILSRIVRVWRQLFVGKALVGNRSAKDLAAAALVPMWKAGDFAAGCRKFEWKQLAAGFRLLLQADRAFKTSTPNPEGYFDVMLWKLIG